MKILSWPQPYEANPYLHRLRDALGRHGVHTRTERYLASLSLRTRGATWLHLHWPEWMLRDQSRARAWARALWFFAIVDSLRARGVRLAWTAHNLVGHDEPHADLAITFRRMFLRRCALVHGHFPSAEASVRELGFEGRFVMAGHPHALDDYRPTMERERARESLGFSQGDRVLLCFGAIERYKGFDRVCEAFVKLDDPSLRLLIAGRASEPSALEAVERARQGDRRVVIRREFLSREDSANVALAADAMVLGYRAFFTSGTAMLALSMGTPVIGPARNHLAMLESEPFFSPMSEPAELSSALASPTLFREETRSLARAWALRFTYDSLAERLSEAFSANEVR
ncbi:MAG: glycosyltransferase [Polyangiales bacterium]